MAYPSIVTSFSTKVNGQVIDASDVNNVQTDVVAIETFVGTLSSVAGTLINDVRAAASNGGGHVQTANKGGTGQTAFAKGDLLVAMSSSVLSKLTVGSDAQILTSDSSQSVGVKWASNTGSTPGWVDEGTLTWTASSADQTLTLANAGKNLYQVLINFTTYANTTNLDLIVNGVATGTTYNYTYISGNAVAITSAANRITLIDTNGGSQAMLGTVMINGKKTASVGYLVFTGNLVGDTGSQTMIKGYCTAPSTDLTSIKIFVNGATVTGKVHVYSLNL